MDFVLKPSLQYMALVKIVVSLWNQNDVRHLLTKVELGFWTTDEEKEEIEERVIEKVSQLSLPQSLEKKVLNLINPIGSQLLKWMKFHYRSFRLHLDLPTEICWNLQGTIDRKRTAEILIKNENLDISSRYKLACIYCLEDDIIEFWSSMPEELKESDWTDIPIISFWSRNMKRSVSSNAHISYKAKFNCYARGNNKAAVEYFFHRLTPQEKNESLVKAATSITDADVLCFLLSVMDEKQQIEVFKVNPLGVLTSFLEWPWQSFFIGAVNYMWNFLSEFDYISILLNIIGKLKKGYKDCNYQKLFQEFWQESPHALKGIIVDKIDESWLMKDLFRMKDKESISLILKDATHEAKEKLLFSDSMHYRCQCFIRDNEWDFLGFCIRECSPSNDEMLKFKKEFEKSVGSLKWQRAKNNVAWDKQKWDQLFSSEASICRYDKRSTEGECSSSKKFHSPQ